MKTRSKIELLVVIAVIVAKTWALRQQFSEGGLATTLILGGVALAAIVCLLRRMSGLAFVLALGSIFSAVGLVRWYAFAPSHSLGLTLTFAREEAIYLTFALCLLDLWAEWRRSEALAEVRA
jgi:hypothetical protein